MKKLTFIAAILAASLALGANFASRSNSEIISSIDAKDAKTLAGAAFEIHKRASSSTLEFSSMCKEFHNIMQNELKGKNKEQTKAFEDEFHNELKMHLDSLDADERAKFDSNICSKMMKKWSKGGKHHVQKIKNHDRQSFHHGDKAKKMNGCKNSSWHNNCAKGDYNSSGVKGECGMQDCPNIHKRPLSSEANSSQN